MITVLLRMAAMFLMRLLGKYKKGKNEIEKVVVKGIILIDSPSNFEG